MGRRDRRPRPRRRNGRRPDATVSRPPSRGRATPATEPRGRRRPVASAPSPPSAARRCGSRPVSPRRRGRWARAPSKATFPLMAYAPFDLSGHVALVTGGNSGIGLGMAEALAQAGADVAVWGTNEAKNADAAALLE